MRWSPNVIPASRLDAFRPPGQRHTVKCKQKPNTRCISLAGSPPNLLLSSIMRLVFLTAIAAVAAAQQDPIQDFCRRHLHQTCVIDSKLYIDGGMVHFGGSVENGSIAQQSKCVLVTHLFKYR
jgi:hypothetical protein